jgi:septum formation protein
VMKLVLASGSPRRRELMALIAQTFTVCPVDADETLRRGAPLDEEVVRLSRLKAEAALGLHPDAVCIGSDTMVTIDGLPLGKPENAAHAAEMLRRLRGRTHEVLTGLAVLLPDGTARTLCTRTRVTFRDFAEDELAAYLATGEPMDKAGAYGIQGRGALLIAGIEGDYYSVMGLPVAGLHVILRELGAI